MKFLERGEIHTAVRRLVESSRRLDFAVAFWGEGATKRLNLQRLGAKRVRMICNLALGGTNPAAIKSLQSRAGKRSVRQLDDLHAKVYCFDSEAIVGSANASANGLALEGEETRGFSEAALRTDNITTVESVRKWFQTQWANARGITKEDLERAERRWNQRRESNPPFLAHGKTCGDGVTEQWLRERADKFHVIWYGDRLDQQERATARKLKPPELPDTNLGYFKDDDASVRDVRKWYKPGSIAFCFFVSADQGVKFDGLAYFVPGELLTRRASKCVYTYYQELSPNSLPPSMRTWSGLHEINTRRFRAYLKGRVVSERGEGGAVSLYEFLKPR